MTTDEPRGVIKKPPPSHAKLRSSVVSNRLIVIGIGMLWSLFQLSVASWWILDTVTIRSVHLSFALLLCFIRYPARFSRLSEIVPFSRGKSFRQFDILVALAAAFSALYLSIDYPGLAARQGVPILRDLIIGGVLMLFLLEGTRRVIGPALPLIAIAFIGYSFLGPYMPQLLMSRGVSIERFIGQMTMSTEGIYGIPLHVSASIVFMFVLFGALLERAGAGNFFVRLSLSLLGGVRGGPAKAAILSSAATGLFSGSSIANIVTTGTFTIPMMKRVGYPPKKAAAIEVAASTDGQLMPPIMGAAAFIIAEYVNVPYIDVVKAAAIPAFASYGALFYITHLEACKLGLTGIPREELPRLRNVLRDGFHYLVPLLYLFYQLVVLRYSPDMAVFRAIVVLSVIMLLQHPVRAFRTKESIPRAFRTGIGDICHGLSVGANNMVSVALATAAAGIIVGVVTLGLGGLVTEIIDVISGGNLFIMLVITAIASLILGMGLPTTATYIVMASLTAKALVDLAAWHEFHIPLMAAHLFCFYFGILADDTPPVGLAAYAASAIAKSRPIPTGLQGFMYDIRTAIIPFMFVMNPDIILHTIDNWPLAILIFIMTATGACAFAAATQGWFIARNRPHETVLLLLSTFILMRPDFVSTLLTGATDLRHWMYPLGIVVLIIAYFLQRPRYECGGRREVLMNGGKNIG